jgi:diguanylate cyclase (GGDEF)-like protein
LSESENITPFSFEAVGHEAVLEAAASERVPAVGNDQLRMAVEASGLATYHWTIESDEIIWSPNVEEVLGSDPRAFLTGRGYASFLDPDNFTSRYDTVMRSSLGDDGAGVAFQIEYKFRPDGRMGRASVWVEDQGRWYAGADGRPVEVFGTVRRIDDRHMRDQHLSFLGNCDPLTGMMNRGRMMEALGGAMSVAGRDNTNCAFLIAAINNLSVVNDAYGFEVADEVIINMGRRLRQVVRTGDAIARYSGSKFGLILNNCGEDDLIIAAERFLSVARESVIETERGPVWALLSIGALILPKHASDPNTAVARAEEALTEARKLPSDGFVIYKPSQQRSSERTLNAHSATEIVRCLREERFRLAFQPIVEARSGEPAFHEALLRMTDQAGEIVAAGHLIPIAEKLGLVRLIDRAVVQMTVAALNKYPDAKLSFNISGTTATDPRWYPQIIEILASNRNVTNRMIVEITETVALGDLRETIRFVEQLRELGCGVAIDDFGAGYTSFRNLRAMPVDVLKLDGTFCSNLSGNSDNQYFVRSLIDLARTFDIRTVAEWVETEEDAALLREWGVDLMQGNLFGEARLEPPWPEAEGAATFTMEEAIPFSLPPELLEPELDEEDTDITFDVPVPAMTKGAEVTEAFDFAAPAEEGQATALDATEENIYREPAVAIEPEAWAAPDLEAPQQQMAVAEAPIDLAPDGYEAAGFVPEEPLQTWPEPVETFEQSPEPLVAFEGGLEGELAKLREAIAALDRAFRQPPLEQESRSEPSFADLVSDTAMRRAG